MKITFTILFYFLSISLYSQQTYPFNKNDFRSLILREYNYVYDQKNSDVFLKKAQELIELNNRDSSIKATKIMFGLNMYDNKKYTIELFEPFLQRVNKSNKVQFENLLIGSWRFLYDFGVGMVTRITTTTDIDTLNTVIFDGSKAFFYFRDSLIRQTYYSLVPNVRGFDFTRYNKFNIYFDDNNTTWGFSVNNSESSQQKLTIDLDIYCACGCRLDIYKKIGIVNRFP